jgi:hypothetical protein
MLSPTVYYCSPAGYYVMVIKFGEFYITLHNSLKKGLIGLNMKTEAGMKGVLRDATT